LPDVASPVLFNGLVFFVTDAGDVACHDVADGKRVWAKECENGFYMSPVVVEGKLYVADREKGEFRIYTADRAGKELAVIPMGEAVNATPAFVGKRVYIRANSTLWCVEEKK
jgi:outer membrane protein assembly factor BamB